MRKKLAAMLLAAVMTVGLLPLSACSGGQNTTATTMHLRRTEGTVVVSDGGGKDVPLLDNLGLYSGYGVGTQSVSYAWIDLDDVKLTKLDQNSEIAIQQDGKKLDIELKSGSLFFNVTQPLEDDETMNIRTSTMLVGIRGTCGWVEERSGLSRVYILEGKVECSAGGQTVQVSAWGYAELTADGNLVVEPFTVEDILAFVQDDVNPDLIAGPDETPGPDATESPEPVIPYAEANGLSFSKEKSYTLPAFTYLVDMSSGEPISINGVSISGVVDASYTFGDISVTEADADGMVQMIIPYHVDFTTTVTDDFTFEGDYGYNWGCVNAGVFDYYTGTVIPTNGTLYGDSILENAIDITYQDVTYPIAYTRNMTAHDDLSDWVNVGGGIYELQITVAADFTYTIYMPKEYDGLCLLLSLSGQTERPEDREDSSDIGYLLDAVEEAGEDINNLVLMRVSDFI